MGLTPGLRLGTYEVGAAIGRGGMGEVFRARDVELQRDVALKVLPALFAANAQRLARFRREAQILASLNHPNIASIYGILEVDGVRALVLELADGQTLAERLRRGPVPVLEALPLALQIAQALEAAHDKGIIHRDLKPANITLSDDGRIKVLDFGLAKAFDNASQAAHPDEPTLTESGQTELGAVMGTTGYMSPEQARGRPVDKRTDIWAFGCVMFEMLTGEAPFRSETSSDTVAAVLGRDPDWRRLPDRLPPRILALLRRCLDKDHKERLRDIGDARLELRDAIAAGPAAESLALGGAPSGVGPWRAAAIVLGLAALALATVSFALSRKPPAVAAEWRNPLADAVFARLTDFDGAESSAAISPDGRFVAFRADRDGPQDIWLTQVGTGTFVNLTRGKEEELLLPVRNMGFTPDGSEIWLAGLGSANRRLRLVPMMGGTPRVFLRENTVNVSFAPDGARVVYHTNDAGDPLFVADRVGASARQVFVQGPAGHNHFPTWSPDGRWIYFVSGIWQTRQMDVWRIAPEGGAPERLTSHDNDVRSVTPLDARTVLYVSPDADGSGPWLWALDVDSRQTRRVSYGLERYTSVAASLDGRRLVATVSNPTASLWSTPILDRVAEDRDAQRVDVPSVRAHVPRFGGQALFYLSSTGAGDGLWRLQDGQAAEIWKAQNGPLHIPPAVSYDGRRIVLPLRRQQALRLHVMSADGAELQPFGDTIQVQGAASWSPDGTWVAVGGNDGSGAGLFKIPIDGGAPVRLVTGSALNPEWAPDSSLIVYTGTLVGNQAPLLAVRPDGTPVALPPITIYGDGNLVGARYRFLRNGRGLVYMQGSSLWQEFWLLDMSTTTPATAGRRQLTRFTSRASMRTFDITPDGTRIVFDRAHDNSDVVLIDRK